MPKVALDAAALPSIGSLSSYHCEVVTFRPSPRGLHSRIVDILGSHVVRRYGVDGAGRELHYGGPAPPHRQPPRPFRCLLILVLNGRPPRSQPRQLCPRGLVRPHGHASARL
ncbi:hypothetical protein BN9982_140036 [Mycobacterium tuberculosis]|nr:hypothetical protein BN9982_140036 [Mycobacterium tuberculosis]